MGTLCSLSERLGLSFDMPVELRGSVESWPATHRCRCEPGPDRQKPGPDGDSGLEGSTVMNAIKRRLEPRLGEKT